jgi:ketosteroid isomerase-like protein
VTGDTEAQMARENLEIVRRSNRALNRGDLAGALVDYAEDAVFRDLRTAPDVPAEARGRGGIMAVIDAWAGTFEELEAQIVDVVDAGDFVVAETYWRGRGKGSGVAIDAHQFDLFELRNGEFVATTLGFRSRDEAMSAAGISVEERDYSQPRRRK